jgi:putative transposase
LQDHPKFKKKGVKECSYYFVRTDKKQPIQVERHRIKIPCLGWVQLKEYGYLPTEHNLVSSGTIKKIAGRYYISVKTHETTSVEEPPNGPGIGIDLGLKDFAVVSNGTVYETDKQQKLHKRLKRAQRKLSRKNLLQKEKGGTASKSIERQRLKVAKIHQRIANVRNNRQNQIVKEIARAKPSYITMEDLNVKGMMKNRHLSKAVARQGFYEFRQKLTCKAKARGIEVRVVDRFYPSSKLCNHCGAKKIDLKLRDRVFRCAACGYSADRDLNAAVNLRDSKAYEVK